MAAVELPRHLLVVLMSGMRAVARLEHLAREGLHGGGRQHLREFGQVRAAVHAAQPSLHVAAEVLQQVQADQLAVVGSDRVTVARIRNPERFRHCIDDVGLGVDCHAQDHVVHRVAGGSHTGGKREVARLGIGELRLEIPEAVIARVGVDSDRTRVHVAAVGHLRQKKGPPWKCLARPDGEI
jgi:hypothetical protein